RLELRRRRRVAVVEGDVDAPARALLRLADAPDLLHAGGHRLFGDDVGAGFQRRDDDVVVIAVLRADDHQFGPSGAQRLLDRGVDRGVGLDHGPRPLRPQRIGVADGDEIDVAAPALQQVLAPHGGAAIARADQRVAPPPVIHNRPLAGCGEALGAGGEYLVARPRPPIVPGKYLDFLRTVIARRLDHAAYAAKV